MRAPLPCPGRGNTHLMHLIVPPQHVLGNLHGRAQEEKEHIVRYPGHVFLFHVTHFGGQGF